MDVRILFLIVFCETGLVVTPFLPGDALLFAAGAIAALPEAGLSVDLLAVLLAAAAVTGDAVNYTVGTYVGERVAARFVKAAHLERTRAFYARHGGKTIVLARFVPIVRTLAPFVAGMGAMEYRRFFVYNVDGALAWVLLFLYAGYFFGGLPWVEETFSVVILGVIALSLVPLLVEWLRHRRQPAGGPAATAAAEAATDVVAAEDDALPDDGTAPPPG